MAHGAGRGIMPGNTLEAAIYAHDIGSDVIEIDIHATADGILVVRHDAEINTTTNGAGLIKDLDFEALQAFTVGFHDSDIDSGARINPGNIKIASLKSLFEALPSTRFMIEMKPNDNQVAESFCQLIRETGNGARLNVVSFHLEVLQHFRKVCPEIATSLSQDEVTNFVLLTWLGLGHLYQAKGIALQVPMKINGIKILSPSLISAAHNLGLAIDVWTIDDANTMQMLIDMQVDGIITNRPDRMVAIRPNN